MNTFHKILIASIFGAITCCGSMNAAIKVYNIRGNVIKEKGKTQSVLKTNDILTPDVTIIIPENGQLEVLNDISNIIYTSTSNGRMPLSRMISSAERRSRDNADNVHRHMRRFDGSDKNKDGRVYVEKGMVTRTMGEYDPEAGNVELDIPTLAGYIRAIVDGRHTPDSVPVKICHSRNQEAGLSFRLENTLDFPIYFNILKIKNNTDGTRSIAISEIGQPAGTYVILPRQSLSRENFGEIPADERHLIIATHCQFDMDRLLEMLNQPESASNLPIVQLPIYVTEL